MKQNSPGGVGEWLRTRCQEEGLSLRQAAKRTGLSHATIADIGNGGKPSPESLLRLAKAFGGDGNLKMAIEEKLLTLAGYRTPRPGGEANELVAQLLDKLTGLSPSKMEMVGHFIDFVNALEEQQ